MRPTRDVARRRRARELLHGTLERLRTTPGTTTLTVNNGDTFGFTITGSNGDLELVPARHPARRDERGQERQLRDARRPRRRLRHDPDRCRCPDADRLDGRSGNVDLLNDTYWNAADGNQSIDLDGDDAGQPSRRRSRRSSGRSTTSGSEYSANPESADPAPTMARQGRRRPGRPAVQRHPSRRRVLAHPTRHRLEGPAAVSFTATTASTTLTFASTDRRRRVRRRPRRRHRDPGPRRRRRRSRRASTRRTCIRPPRWRDTRTSWVSWAPDARTTFEVQFLTSAHLRRRRPPRRPRPRR